MDTLSLRKRLARSLRAQAPFAVTPNPASAGALLSGGVTITVNGTTVASNFPLTASHDPSSGGVIGTAELSLNVVDLYEGTDTITVSYSGDTNYQPSSASGTIVSAAPPSLELDAGAFINPGPADRQCGVRRSLVELRPGKRMDTAF